ncbi:hypothetical protein ACLOJK_023789 [Asimina triloba]
MSALSSLIKAKSMALKSKTSGMKARLIIFNLLRSKRVLLPDISRKLHTLLHPHNKHCISDNEEAVEEDDPTKRSVVVYSALPNEAPENSCQALSLVYDDEEEEEEEEDDRYPDLTHSLFDELEFDDGQGSVVDLVKSAREDGGSNFNLEDEIDHVADVFIRRIRRQMQMQKQDSFKRYKEMLERSL